VLARERKRLANPVEREPKFVVFHPLQFGIREKSTGDFAWADFKSVRDVERRLAAIRRYYFA
jgi:hypothetical protein